MNLIDALKSGKRFKRQGETYYNQASDKPDKNFWYDAVAEDNYYEGQTFYIDEVLADDWEIEAAPVTITREQFNKAWDNSLRNEPRNNWELHAFLIKQLGL